jgi:hypothetical protein
VYLLNFPLLKLHYMYVFCFQHIVISSGAASPFHVRGPYDVINLYPLCNFGRAFYGTSILNCGHFIYATLRIASVCPLLH